MSLTEIEEFLKPEECKRVIEILDSNYVPGTGIRQDAEMARKLIEIIGPKLPQFTFTNHVSTGNNKEAVPRHIDPKLDPRVSHKLLIYLNEVETGGGTFFEKFGYIKPGVGKAVIFDITIPHWSEGFPKSQTKKVFGLRMYHKEA